MKSLSLLAFATRRVFLYRIGVRVHVCVRWPYQLQYLPYLAWMCTSFSQMSELCGVPHLTECKGECSHKFFLTIDLENVYLYYEINFNCLILII